jgi:hypothetical protein
MRSDPDYAKKWRAKQDPEKRRAYAKAYREKNRERVRGYANKYSKAYKRLIKKRNEERPCAPNKPQYIKCNKCGVVKLYDVSQFHERTSNKWKLSNVCRDCTNKTSLERVVMRKYGMTHEQAKAFRSAPCFLCGSTERVHIDHCHVSGVVRKPLCSQCNNGLGCFRDNPDVLRKAAKYAEDFRVFT